MHVVQTGQTPPPLMLRTWMTARVVLGLSGRAPRYASTSLTSSMLSFMSAMKAAKPRWPSALTPYLQRNSLAVTGAKRPFSAQQQQQLSRYIYRQLSQRVCSCMWHWDNTDPRLYSNRSWHASLAGATVLQHASELTVCSSVIAITCPSAP